MDLGTVRSMEVLEAEVSSKGGAVTGITESSEGVALEQLGILGRRSGHRKVFDLSRLWEDALIFFLGLQWACRYVEHVVCLGCS